MQHFLRLILALLLVFVRVFFIGSVLMKKGKKKTLDVYLFRKECS